MISICDAVPGGMNPRANSVAIGLSVAIRASTVLLSIGRFGWFARISVAAVGIMDPIGSEGMVQFLIHEGNPDQQRIDERLKAADRSS